jgi:hypothetical protein
MGRDALRGYGAGSWGVQLSPDATAAGLGSYMRHGWAARECTWLQWTPGLSPSLAPSAPSLPGLPIGSGGRAAALLCHSLFQSAQAL